VSEMCPQVRAACRTLMSSAPEGASKPEPWKRHNDGAGKQQGAPTPSRATSYIVVESMPLH